MDLSNLAFFHYASDWQTLEGTLIQDMATLSSYLLQMEAQTQYNKDSVGTLLSIQQEGAMWLYIFFNGQVLPFCAEPTYLGIKLDRAFTFRRHLKSLRKKLTSRVRLLKRLSGSSWGADATIFRTATLALVHFTTECCAFVWCCSAHTRLIDKFINDVLRIVTGCLRPTPTDNLFILAGIQPTELCRQKAELFLARRAQEPGHLLY